MIVVVNIHRVFHAFSRWYKSNKTIERQVIKYKAGKKHSLAHMKTKKPNQSQMVA